LGHGSLEIYDTQTVSPELKKNEKYYNKENTIPQKTFLFK